MNTRLHDRLGAPPVRMAAGVPSGGQFAASERAEAAVALAEPVADEPLVMVAVRPETLSPGLTVRVRVWDGETVAMDVVPGPRTEGTATSILLADPETGFQSEWDFTAGERIDVETNPETTVCDKCGGVYTGDVCRTDTCS